MSSRAWVAVVVGVLAVVAVVLLLPRGADSTGEPDTRVEIVMQDYEFETGEWTVPAGREVSLVLINNDEVSHPLTFGGELIVEDGRPADYTNELFAGLSPRVSPEAALVEPSEDHEGFTVRVQGGDTVTVGVEFPEDRVGTWGVGCFIGQGCHFNAGLEGTLHVVE